MRKLAWVLIAIAFSGCPSDDKPKPDSGPADSGESDSVDAGEGGSGGSGSGGSSGAAPGAGAGAAAKGGGGGSSGGAGAASGGGGGGGTGGASGQGAASGGGGSSGAAGPAGSTMIVGVGSAAFRGWSSDGATWKYCGDPSGGNDHAPKLLRNIGYGDGVFIAVGGDANGMVMRSLDALHWQEDLHPTNACPGDGYPSSCANWMGAVAFHAGTWLAAGGNGAVMRSTDGGSTWKGLKSMSDYGRIRTMGAGSGRFLAGADVSNTGGVGAVIWVSADNGDHWANKTPWTSAPMNAYLDFAHGAGTFIAFTPIDGSAGDRACFLSSDAGDTWEVCAASVKSNTSFVHDGAQWVTPANGGYATSPDGKTWTTHTASNVPSMLLFDGKTWFGRSGGTIYRGAALDSFAKVGMNVSEFRGWAIGPVLDKNLPVTGVSACVDNR
ncbi:MAG TPA: hypothetical protein VFG30_33940 [Polyangiales bacterium]|nr:hypothetical protein [Polyangiales bacterium]